MPLIPKFSYNVTRDYPYKWFTPVAIVGGILLTVLFSAINFFSTAYTMVPVTTDQPHNIEAGLYGGSYAHLFASKYQPKCDDASLALGSNFRTNRSLFEYQLTSFGGSAVLLGRQAIAYRNAAIKNCSANRVMLDFSTYDRPASQINISAWGLAVTVSLRCHFQHSSGDDPITFTVQTQIDPIKDVANGPQNFWLGDTADIQKSKPMWRINPHASPALNWVQVLMLMFWKETIAAMANQTTTFTGVENSIPRYNLTHGYVQLDRFSDRLEDMQDDRYFDKASWVFFDAAKNEKYIGSIGASNNTESPDLSIESVAHSSAWPRIWSPVDRLAKAVLSAVSTDLNNSSKPHTTMVSGADSLRYWSANLSTIAEQSSIFLGISYYESQDVTVTDYDTQQKLGHGGDHTLRTLPKPAWDVSPVVISATYVCQQPQRKSPLNIFISILVADLVFLRTAWTLYSFIVAYFLKSRHTEANICDRCLARSEDDEVVEKEGKDGTTQIDKAQEVDEHTIELDYLGPPGPPARRDDQCSAQGLLTHRHV